MDNDLTQFLDMNIPGYDYLWTCTISLHSAISGFALQFQYLGFFMILFLLIWTIPHGVDVTSASSHTTLTVHSLNYSSKIPSLD